MSVRSGAKHLDMSPNTIRKSLHTLEALGYIRCTQKGYFEVKTGSHHQPSQWALTFLGDYTGDDKKAFARLSPDKASNIIKEIHGIKK